MFALDKDGMKMIIYICLSILVIMLNLDFILGELCSLNGNDVGLLRVSLEFRLLHGYISVFNSLFMT